MTLEPRHLCFAALLACLVVSGCMEPPTGPITEEPPAEVPTSHFDAEPRASGAGFWLQGGLNGGEATVEIWAGSLGQVFGYSLQLAYDADHLQLVPGSEGELNELVLSAGVQAAPIYLRKDRPGTVVLGAVRRGVAEGERPVDGPVRLATARLKVLKPGTSQLRLERTQVRRANGEFTPAQVSGAALVTVAGAL
jgi:hypothetical protein